MATAVVAFSEDLPEITTESPVESLEGVHEKVSPTKGGVRAPLRGWLSRQKAGVFSTSNRRFFTLDFATECLYYSRSADEKQSFPTPFCDLFGVDLLSSTSPTDGEAASTGSATASAPAKSSMFHMPRMPSLKGLARRPVEAPCGFSLHTRQRSMVLLCSTQAEAEEWVRSLRDAVKIGAARHTTPATTAPSSGHSSPRGQASDSSEVVPPAAAEARGSWAVEGLEAPAAKVPTNVTAIEAVTADDTSLVNACAWGEAQVPGRPAETRTRYTDKAEGLSLQHRLEQLEFSSDEEDEGLPREKPQLAEQQQEEDEETECQTFVAPASDSDEEA